MKLIDLKTTNAQCVEITSLDQLCPKYLKDKIIDNKTRYCCIFYNNEVKCYEVILCTEKTSKTILNDIKEQFELQISVLKQLCH